MRYIYVLILIMCYSLTACSQKGLVSEDYTQTQIAQAVANTQAAYASTKIYTNTPIITNTPVPTNTPYLTQTSRPTYTPRPTYTQSPTSTPVAGLFQNPGVVGMSIERTSGIGDNEELRKTIIATLLEVHRGDEANRIAKSELDWLTYKTPIEEQEYIAIKVLIDVVEADPNNVLHLFPYWSFTLRYEDGGSDTYGVDILHKAVEAYPPISVEVWLFYLVRTESQPLLYFQPELFLYQEFGLRTDGAYFKLTQP